MKRKNIKAADVMRQESNAVVGSKNNFNVVGREGFGDECNLK